MNKAYSTPILFIIYDRAETALEVLQVIKKIEPSRLFIASDGPAGRYEEESKNVFDLRNKVIDRIDWQCEIKTLFGEINKGPRVWIGSAIDWFFEEVEEGIILEHDCLPDISFFIFCEALLDKYREDEEVMHISGANFLFNEVTIDASYYFSNYPFIWGWATWRRAWKKYDKEMNQLEEFMESGQLQGMFKSRIEYDYWRNVFLLTQKNRFNTWDYQWIFSIWQNRGIVLNSSKNLVSNIGYGDKGVNTNYKNTILANLPRKTINVIQPPQDRQINKNADRVSFENYFGEHLSNLFEQNETLKNICDERLELIQTLVKTAEDRLSIIESLNKEINNLRNK